MSGSDGTDPRLLLLAPEDNVLVLRERIGAGEVVLVEGEKVASPGPIQRGHKLARGPIAPGEKIVKYGVPIGSATAPIARGDHVHVHNIRSDYTPTHLVGA